MTLRRLPTDFIVHEIPDPGFHAAIVPEPTRECHHAVFELQKLSLTTPEALGMVARSLKIKAGTIDYAGLKDKHASTTQWISVASPKKAAALALPAEHREEMWQLKRIGWSPTPVTAASIEGNRFTLVVRGLSVQQDREMDRRASLLTNSVGSMLVTNYFGDQRFGSARHGEGFAAIPLIRGDFEGALKLAIGTPARKDAGKTRIFSRALASGWGDWPTVLRTLPNLPERRAIEVLARTGDFKESFAALPYFLQTMIVEAFQSHIWNTTATLMLQEGLPESVEKLQTKGLFGDNFFVAASSLPESWLTLSIPVLTKSSELLAPWGEFAERALEKEGVKLSELRIPGLRRPFFGESQRPLIARATQFELLPSSKDPLAAHSSTSNRMRTASFTLGRGTYATVVMRALGQ